MIKRFLSLLILLSVAVSAVACGSQTDPRGSTGNTSEIANDYYVDLTELGMKLTVYLRISENGSFIFSNTTSFGVNKSSGTVRKTDDGYLMVYDSVNGEDKSISEGLTSKFVKTDDGSLDFTVCERIYYGTASATTTSAEYPDAKLIARVITDSYEAPTNETSFTAGIYTASLDNGDGVEYTCHIGFYDDSSYLLFVTYVENGRVCFESETGRYGVSTTQLALNPQGGNRVSCNVISDSELSVSVPVAGSGERTELTFNKTENRSEIAVFSGTVKKTGTDETVSASMTLYSDGGFTVKAGEFTENGLIAPDSKSGIFKIYPDHPSNGARGVNQVATVPAGVLAYGEDGKLTLSEFRVRTSDSLNRDKCTFVQE